MATTNISLTITTPTGVTIAEAIDLFTEHHGYTDDSGMTKGEFAKKTIARQVAETIRVQQVVRAKKTAETTELSKPVIQVE